MGPARSLTVINLGGGVQFSVMALMASDGTFDPLPDCAIFADTGWEPPGIYTHISWLAEQISFPYTSSTTGATSSRTLRLSQITRTRPTMSTSPST